mgnify:CR=1 FL=1
MGLDQYAYVASKAGQRDEFYDQEGIYFDPEKGGWVVPEGGMQKPRQISYWRKHPNLHGWMEKLWNRKNQPGIDHSNPNPMNDVPVFNGVELELTWEDIDELERAIRHGQLPHTTGFFFGDPSDDYYREQDLKFCIDAKAELFLKRKVFYNSSW